MSRRRRSAEDLVDLADKYKSSREAMLRRYVEIHEEAVAVVFLEWKLKPRQSGVWDGVLACEMLLGIDPREEADGRRRLRVDYAIVSGSFRDRYTAFIPPDKSIDDRSVIHEVASSRYHRDAEEWLDLGPVRGPFRLNAIPIPTPPECRGPGGEFMVAVVLWPVAQGKKKPTSATPSLF